MTVSCVLADDHFVVREGLRRYLDTIDWIDVVGEAEDGQETLELIERLSPEVALVDVKMSKVSGLEVLRRIRRRDPHIKIVIFSALTDTTTVRTALHAGANGFLSKNSAPDLMEYALRQVAAGKRFVDPTLAMELIADEPAELSERQRQVLQLIAHGQTNARIAESLELSQETVRTHVTAILDKLQAETRAQAVAIAIRESLIDPPEQERALI